MVTASWVRRVAIGRDALVFSLVRATLRGNRSCVFPSCGPHSVVTALVHSLVRATLRGNRLQTPSRAEPFRMVTAHVDISLRAELFRQ
jgi:hypothetical protein